MQLQSLLALLVAAAAAGDGWAGQAALEGWADVINTERLQGRLLPRVSDLQPGLDLDEAYAIQRALITVERPRRGIGGYKAGFTNPASRVPYGLNGPVTGVLYADGARTDGATVDLADFHRLVIEVEIGFVLRSPIRRPMKSLDDLMTYVREVVPVIELPDLAYDQPERLRGLDIVATNMAASAYIVGAPLRLSRPAAVNDIDVVLYRDDEPIDTGQAANAMGDQLGALLWLVNHLQAAGLPLEAGHVLITGTLGKMNTAIAGHYRADYAGAGKVAFEVVGTAPATAQVK